MAAAPTTYQRDTTNDPTVDVYATDVPKRTGEAPHLEVKFSRGKEVKNADGTAVLNSAGQARIDDVLPEASYSFFITTGDEPGRAALQRLEFIAIRKIVAATITAQGLTKTDAEIDTLTQNVLGAGVTVDNAKATAVYTDRTAALAEWDKIKADATIPEGDRLKELHARTGIHPQGAHPFTV